MWRLVVAAVFVLALGVSSWTEAFGPAGIARADLEPGDVIVWADGRTIASPADWFLVRANIARRQPAALRIRRGANIVALSVTVETPNWRTWPHDVWAFRFARVAILALAVALASWRRRHPGASIAALMLAMIATAEAFPPAGWAAVLRGLPMILSLPAALASVSWMLIAIPWFWWATTVPPTVIAQWQRVSIVAATLAVFGSMLTGSATTFITQPAAAAAPFATSAELHTVEAVFGVMPMLFLKQPRLIALWIAMTITLIIGGLAFMRRRRPVVFVSVLALLVLGIHNVLVRNGRVLIGGFAAEAVVVTIVVTATMWLGFADRSPLNDVHQKQDDSDHQQDVKQATHGVAGDQAEHPENQQQEHEKQHRSSSSRSVQQVARRDGGRSS